MITSLIISAEYNTSPLSNSSIILFGVADNDNVCPIVGHTILMNIESLSILYVASCMLYVTMVSNMTFKIGLVNSL